MRSVSTVAIIGFVSSESAVMGLVSTVSAIVRLKAVIRSVSTVAVMGFESAVAVMRSISAAATVPRIVGRLFFCLTLLTSMALGDEGHKGQKHDRMNYDVDLHFDFRIFKKFFVKRRTHQVKV